MSRTSRIFVSFFMTWIITRFFYWVSGFDPIHDLKGFFGYLVDLGVWGAVWFSVVGVLDLSRTGKKPRA